MNLTKRRKKNWLSALKSGKYKQGFNKLKSEDGSYCCLGVLACVLNKRISHGGLTVIGEKSPSGFDFFYKMLGERITDELWKKNDEQSSYAYQRDYSNVIPIIRKLKTIN